MAIISGGFSLPLFTYAANFPPPIVGVHRAMLNDTGFGDRVFGGNGEIRGDPPGLTTFDGVPGRAVVSVLVRKTRQMIRQVRSNPDGSYRIINLANGIDYIVLGVDENDQDNAVVVDRVQAGIP